MPSTPGAPWYTRWWDALLSGLRAPREQLEPLGSPPWLWGPQYASAAQYAQLYRAQPHVRTVVGFLAIQLGQLGIHVYRRLSDTDRVRVHDHPLARLLRAPNEGTTRAMWIAQLVQDLNIFGNAYAVKLRPRDRLSLYRVPPGRMRPHGDLAPRAYTWSLEDGRTVALPAEDVFHLRLYDPETSVAGLSPLETLRRLLAEETAATEYRAWFWQNGARLSGTLSRPSTAPKWTPEQREQFRNEWRAFTGPQNAGKTPVLEDGMTFEPVTATARDSELIAARKLTREEVAAAYHVPPAMIGILEAQGYGSLREQHKALYQDTLGPFVALLEGEIERQLLTEFSDSEGVYVQFNIAEKLQGSFEEETQALAAAVGSPYMSRNEARARLNLPKIADPAFDKPVTRLDLAEGQERMRPAPQASASPILLVEPAPPLPAPDLDLEPFTERLERALYQLPGDFAAQLPPPPPHATTRRLVRGEDGRVIALEDRGADGALLERRALVRDAQGRVIDLVAEPAS